MSDSNLNIGLQITDVLVPKFEENQGQNENEGNNLEQSEPSNSQTQNSPEPTFATTTEDIDVHLSGPIIESKNSLLNQPDTQKSDYSQYSVSSDGSDDEDTHFSTSTNNRTSYNNNISNGNNDNDENIMDFNQFKQMLRNQQQPKRSASHALAKYKPHFVKPESANLSREQVEELANRAIKGQSLHIDDLATYSAVIEVLNDWRLEALENSEYLKSKQIRDVINELKKKVRQKDRESLHQEAVHQNEERYRKAIENLDQVKNEWKEKHKKFSQDAEKEASELLDRQTSEVSELEAKWQDPSTQRRFTKRSTGLLQQKAVEKYMVLAGDLENAEAQKKRNLQIEKAEASVQYASLQESFEAAQTKLLEEQEIERQKLKEDQDIRYKLLLKDEATAIEVATKKIQTAKQILDDEADLDRFIAKKFKRAPNQVLPMSYLKPGADELPPLAISSKRSQSQMEESRLTANNNSIAPLQLPPLKVKPINTAKLQTNSK